MNVNYEYYRIFYYVAKYQNLTRAAQALQSNQPNVSRAVRLLEHEVGCTLLMRSNRGITLTPEGERLFAHVSVAVEHLQAAEEELMRTRELQEGSVTIGASETALHMLLLPVLKKFKKAYPDIRIRISNNMTLQAIAAVRNGLVDFAVVASPAEVGKPLIQTTVRDFGDILVGGPSYRSLAEKKVSLEDITRYPLVCMGENTITFDFYQELFRRHHLEFRPELEAATIDQILPIIRSDLGLGFLPEIFAVDALERGEIFQIRLKEEIPRKYIYFIENENHPLSIAARALKKMFFESSGEGVPK